MTSESPHARYERINKQLQGEELARFGEVRLPWIAFPGMHPFHIHWRMGAGESLMEVLRYHHSMLSIPERIAQLRQHGVPADWVWWACERIAWMDPALQGETLDAYDFSFEEVRDVLVGHAIEVVGVPER